MSRAYIYRVTVHATPTINLGGNRNVLIEEDITLYFNTAAAAQDFSDQIFDQYAWKCSFVWVPMFEDSEHGMKDAVSKFENDVQEIINSVSPITVAA
jgi:hypothetical protein